MQNASYFVLIPMVYLAAAVFLLGTAWKALGILRGYRHSLRCAVGPTTTPHAMSPELDAILLPRLLKQHPLHWTALIVFHLALGLLILGHLELVFSWGFLQAIPHEIFLGKGLLGLVLFITLSYFLLRRFHSPVREVSEPGDYYILLLLLLSVLFGSQLHLARSLYDYATIGPVEYREYLGSLLALRPVLPEMIVEEGVGHSFLLVAHLLFSNLFLIAFPFSTMMHSLLMLPLSRMRRG